MKSIQLLFVLLLTLALVAGCKKDDKEAEPTKTAIVTAKAWKLDKIFALNQDITSFVGEDLLGELGNSDVKFNVDGTYTSTNRSTNATANGNWEFSADETKMILNKGTTRELTLDVIQLSNSNLDLRQNIDKESIDASQLPIQYQLLLATLTGPVALDIKLIPVQ